MHEETSPAECVGARGGFQPQYVGPMCWAIAWWALDGPIALRNGTNVVNGLHIWIVLAVITSRISVSHGLAVSRQFPCFLRLAPHKLTSVVSSDSNSACLQCKRVPS